jgi:hypothetical protein
VVVITLRDRQGKPIVTVTANDDAVKDGKVDVKKDGKTTTVDLGANSKDSKPPPPGIGSQVTVTDQTGGYFDPDLTSDGFIKVVKKGSKGKVLDIKKVKNVCLIELAKEDGGEKVWILLRLVTE